MSNNTSSNNVIAVSNLEKSFPVTSGSVEVLKGISFDITPGEFIIILGPSGCGKSTLLHIMLGLEKPSTGTVKLLGQDIYAMKNDKYIMDDDALGELRKQKIGMIYQQPQWVRAITVLDNVTLTQLLNGASKIEAIQLAEQMLRTVGMAEWRDYFPTELSAGQQQKIALARAIITDPELIVADEPTGNLDIESGKELMELLKSLNDKGKTVVMVTHDLEYLKYCSRVIKVEDGKIIEDKLVN